LAVTRPVQSPARAAWIPQAPHPSGDRKLIGVAVSADPIISFGARVHARACVFSFSRPPNPLGQGLLV